MPPAPRAQNGPLPPLVILLLLLLCAAWGLNMVAVKVGNQGIAPVFQAGLRSAVAAGLVALWCAARGISLACWREPGFLGPGLVAGALFGGEFLMIYVGLQHTTAARAVLFLYAAPFLVAGGAHLVLPDDRLGWGKAAGLVTAFAGLALAFGDGLHAPAGADTLLGDALLLAGGLFWGATTLVVKATTLRHAPSELVLQYQLMPSALLLLLASLIMGESWAIRASPVVALAFLYQAVGVAFASYLAWFWLVSRHSASRLSAFSFFSPVFGVLAGAALLEEPLRPALLAAVALVALGIWLVNRPDRPAAQSGSRQHSL